MVRARAATLLLALAALAPSRSVFADDPAAPAKVWEGPPFLKDTIALREVDTLEGWKVLPDEGKRPAVEKEMEDAAIAAGAAHGLSREEDVSTLYRSLVGPGDATATVGYVDFFKDPVKAGPALKEAAEKKGWVVKEFTSPARLVLVAAPEAHREKVVAHAMRVGVKRLAEAAVEVAREEDREDAAAALARAVLAVEPRSAGAHFALGLALRPRAQKPPAADWQKAIAELRTSVAADAVSPLDEETRILAWGNLGSFLLQTNGDDAVNREARDALAKAWTAADKKAPGKGGIAYRYDLACAHARLKEKDAAFEQLKGVLEVVTKTPIQGISGWWPKDPDFDVLKDDPRWKEIVAKYPDHAAAGGDGE